MPFAHIFGHQRRKTNKLYKLIEVKKATVFLCATLPKKNKKIVIYQDYLVKI